MNLAMASPISAGLAPREYRTACMASIFSAAVPLPPEMMAPACPIRRPGGAVLPGDKTDHRFLHVLLDIFGGFFFRGPADLAHHDHGMGIRIRVEQRERIDEVRADDRIAADSDAGGLTDIAAG